jgi:type IV secretory pathway ATPase VirB11/archaellum biosynthesis ATPase
MAKTAEAMAALLEDDSVTEIMVDRPDQVYVERRRSRRGGQRWSGLCGDCAQAEESVCGNEERVQTTSTRNAAAPRIAVTGDFGKLGSGLIPAARKATPSDGRPAPFVCM